MGLPTDPKKPLPPLVGLRSDPLKHFTKDKPGWKLLALLVDRMPAILWSIGFVATSILAYFLKP